MCGGGGGSNDAVDYQREQQQKRERRIRHGMDMLRAIFEGGQHGTGQVEVPEWEAPSPAYYAANADPLGGSYGPPPPPRVISPDQVGLDLGTSYFDGEGNVVYEAGSLVAPNREAFRREQPESGQYATDALAMLGVSNPHLQYNDSAYRRAVEDYNTRLRNLHRQASQGRLFTGTQEHEGFDEGFYDERSQAYLDYANPQVDEQFDDAQSALTYALARQGQLRGSLAVDRWGDLERDEGRARQQVGSRAQTFADQARQLVSGERAKLTQMLQSTADPSVVSSNLANVMAGLQARPEFNPIGPLFQNATAGLGSYLENQRYQNARDRYGLSFSDPTSGPGSGTIRG